jgi:hypothetical protein
MDHRIRWGRIVLSAFLLEVAITAFVTPFGLIYGNPLNATSGQPMNTTPYFVSAAVGCAGLGFLFGLWTARKASSRPGLHGLLTGIVASVIYFGLCLLAPGGLPAVIAAYSPAIYGLLNVLRTLGCWMGGLYVDRWRTAATRAN